MRVNTFVLHAAQAAIVERLMARTKRVGECLIWDGPAGDDHPRAVVDGKNRSVRRLLYAELIGPFPDEMRLKPVCANPMCVEPRHFRLLPPGNKRDLARAQRQAAAVAKPVPEKAVTVTDVQAPEPAAESVAPAFWDDGTPRSTGNAFTAAPAKPATLGSPAQAASALARARRPAAQILADAKGGIVIGKPADSDKRAGMRRANI